jgi:agmatine deiminase
MTRPADDGFRLAPDWVPHARCWMAWPVRAESWGDRLGDARDAYAEISAAIARFEPVSIIAKPTKVAEVSLQTAPGVASFSLPHDDSWLRDNGPAFLLGASGEVAGVQWRWNAWGNQYPDHESDAQVAEKLLAQLKMRRYVGPLVVEGGAIGTDGEGTLIASETALLDPKRNPGLDKRAAEDLLKGFLGVEKIIWLGAGIAGDTGGGQIDNIAAFVRPGAVLVLASADPADSNRPVLEDCLSRLKLATDAKGRSLEIVTVEQPRARHADDGRRLPLSYVSFYVANGGVVVPAFEDPADKRAFETINKLFPGREAVQVVATELAHGGGGLHGITLGQPAGQAAT